MNITKETERDFTLVFYRQDRFKIGDSVPTGTTDDFGKTLNFDVDAYVVEVEINYGRHPFLTTVSIKNFLPLSCCEIP